MGDKADGSDRRPTSRSKGQGGPTSWRGGGGRTSRGPAGGKKGSSQWLWKRGSGTKIPLSLKVILLAAAAGALLYWVIPIIQPRKFTPFVALAVTDYDSPAIAPNAFAYEDMLRFQHFWPRVKGRSSTGRQDIGFFGETKNGGRVSEVDNYLRSQLKRLEEFLPNRVGGPSKDTILFYVSAHGVVDQEGRSCLLLSDADPYDTGRWLPVEELLKMLDKEDFVPKTVSGRSTKKILFLDCSRFLEDSRLGVLYNGFYDGLKEALDNSEASNLVIVNSTGLDQAAWSAPKLDGNRGGGTPFAYFLTLGLSGQAWDTDRDGTIALGELCLYLKKQVSDWVRDNRADRQEPEVIASDANSDWPKWKVAYRATEAPPTDPPAANERETGPPEDGAETPAMDGLVGVPGEVLRRCLRLESLWDEYDVKVPSDAATIDPLRLARIHFWLGRLEQLLLAGQAYEDEFEAACEEVQGRIADYPMSTHQRRPGDLTIPLFRPRCEWLRQRDLYGDWTAEPNAAGLEGSLPEDPYEVAATGWLWLCEQAAQPPAAENDAPDWLWLCAPSEEHETNTEQVNQLLELIDTMPQGKVDIVEIAFLRMLKRFLDRDTASSQIGHAIRARALAERAAGCTDVRCHYWLQSLVNAGDQKRRLAEDWLFVGSPKALDEATASWNGLFNVESQYRLALRRHEDLAGAYRTRDEVWAHLPILWQWMFARAYVSTTLDDGDDVSEDSGPKAGWNNLIDLARDTQELAAMLDETDTMVNDRRLDEKVQEIKNASDRVAEDYKGLMDTYVAAWDSLRPAVADVNRRTLRDWGVLLGLPLVGRDPIDGQVELGVGGSRRRELRRTYLGQLFPEDFGSGQVDYAAREAGGNRSITSQDEAPRPLLDLLADRDMCPVSELLDIATPDADSENAPRIELETRKGNSAAVKMKFLASQGQQVRGFLSQVKDGIQDLARQTRRQHENYANGVGGSKSRSVRNELSQADYLLRAMAPLLAPQLTLSDDEHPTKQLRGLDRHFHVLWHCHRVLQDYWGPIRDREDSGQQDMFFELASQHYEEAAENLYQWASRYEREDLGNLRKQLGEVAADESTLTVDVKRPTPAEGGKYAHYAPQVLNTAKVPPGMVTAFFHSSTFVGNPFESGDAVDLWTSPTESLHRFGREVGPEAEPRPFECNVRKEDASADSQLKAVSFYRGHVRPNGYVPPVEDGPNGNTIVFTRKKMPPARIAVHGSSPKDVSVVFILDCSGSMSKEFGERSGTRMGAVVKALKNLLDELARQASQPGRSYRIALRLYGHRTYWQNRLEPDAPAKEPLTTSKYFREQWNKMYDVGIPYPLTPHLLESRYREFGFAWPAEDVEKVKFSAEEADGFCRLTEDFVAKENELDTVLGLLRPCGVTPLYYAIHKSLTDDFGGLSAGDKTSRHLIVLTDGEDDPGYRNNGEIPRHVSEVDYKSLMARLDRRRPRQPSAVTDVKIDAIGIRSNDANLRKIAQATKGEYYAVEKYQDLEDKLQAVLGASRFTVVDDRGREQQGLVETTRVLEGVELPWPPPTARLSKFEVTVEGFEKEIDAHTIFLEGGEDIDLYVDENRGRLTYREFSPDYERPEPMTCSDTRFRVKALARQRQGNDVTFRFSIQRRDDDSTATRRPLVAMAEITPLESGASDPSVEPICVTDFDIEAGTPVPVLRFRVPKWEQWMNHAQVKLWFHPRGDERLRTREINFDTRSGKPDSVDLSIPGIEYFGITTESHGAGQIDVLVTEVYDDSVEDPQPAIVTASPVPQRIERTYGGKVQHRFIYEARETAVDIRILTRQSLKDQCRAKCQAVILTVPDPD